MKSLLYCLKCGEEFDLKGDETIGLIVVKNCKRHSFDPKIKESFMKINLTKEK